MLELPPPAGCAPCAQIRFAERAEREEFGDLSPRHVAAAANRAIADFARHEPREFKDRPELRPVRSDVDDFTYVDVTHRRVDPGLVLTDRIMALTFVGAIQAVEFSTAAICLSVQQTGDLLDHLEARPLQSEP